MAKYETTLYVPRSIEATFAFISDFRNAVKWDPRSYACEKVTEGPIGVGTTFMLTGGMLSREGLVGSKLPKALLGGMPLAYKVVSFDPPNSFTLEGETPVFSYDDRIEFWAEGTGTRVRYSARLEFKSLLQIGEPFLRLMFKRIGDDATRDIPTAVARAS